MSEGNPVEPIWRGDRVFVVGGGQSAYAGLRHSPQLPGRVIAVKDAILLQPKAEIMFYSGKRFHKERPEVWRAACASGAQFWKRAIEPGVPAWVHQVARQKVKDGQINGLSLKPTRLGGWCSGASAVNLAFHLGAAEIVIIGLDFAGAHWSDSHPDKYAYEETHRRHRIAVDAMARPLQDAGVKIANLSAISTLRNWPYVGIEEIKKAGS